MNVLQIVPFPVDSPPRSGGQVRVTECATAYRRWGLRVDRVTVYTKHPRHPERAEDALDGVVSTSLPLVVDWRSRQRRPHLGRPGGLGQFRQMWAFARNPRLAAELAGRLTRSYAVVQCEHPWDFDLALQLRGHAPCAGAKLVYSSHNIEHELQETVWRTSGVWTSAAHRLVTRLRVHETSCARQADLCLATSSTDAAALEAAGARAVVVVPNAVNPLAARAAPSALPASRYAIFVASDFLPNISGFKAWVPPGLEALPAGSAIVLAGSVSRAIERDGSYRADIAAGRIVCLGYVDRLALDQLIQHAHAVLLPISEGGGTNLKTAEALLSLRPVLATPRALRGFERFAQRPRVRVVDDQADFVARLAAMLAAPAEPDAHDPEAQCLTWESAFDALGGVLRQWGLPPLRR